MGKKKDKSKKIDQLTLGQMTEKKLMDYDPAPAWGGRPGKSVFDDIFRRYYAAPGFVWGDAVTSTDSAAEPVKTPPRSYRDARAAVSQWLITAPEQAFDDIVGNDEALEQLRDAIQAPVLHATLYQEYGMRMPKGALLSGPPGSGKTMFARAAASEMRKLYGTEVEFLCLSGGELQGSYVGQTEGRIKAIFTFAREYQAYHGHPLLVFIDEAEVILPDRSSRVRQVHSFEEKQVATFLAEMDGIQESGAFVMLATNRPEAIDPAVLRDGRCDFKITVRRPTAAAVETILRKGFATVKLGDQSVEDLVFAGTEALWNPDKIIMDAHAVYKKLGETEVKHTQVHFLLEHIVSGAMAASIPERAKRCAFARDKAAGVVTGVQVGDVLQAVNQIFEENRGLDHGYAFQEFVAMTRRELLGDER